jgi:hypothetical protein
VRHWSAFLGLEGRLPGAGHVYAHLCTDEVVPGKTGVSLGGRDDAGGSPEHRTGWVVNRRCDATAEERQLSSHRIDVGKSCRPYEEQLTKLADLQKA